MIKVENVDVWGFEHAIRGMRNSWNSWSKSDSRYCAEDDNFTQEYWGCTGCPLEHLSSAVCDLANEYIIGPADMDLMRKLYRGGTEKRKFLRQIFVSMDVTAPLYWWKEADTYKVGTVCNSCSTMHKIQDKEFEPEDFSCEHLFEAKHDQFDARTPMLDMDGYDLGVVVSPVSLLNVICACLNNYRRKYLETGDKNWWWQMIQLLPSSYNQLRTLTMNYENVVTIIKQRTGHKLDEWRDFIHVLQGLPYVSDIMKTEEGNE